MDLSDLLAQLKTPVDAQSSEGLQSSAQSSNYRQPFVSSPIASPPIASPQPQSGSLAGMLSAGNASASDRASSDRTQNLLNLLKFSQPSAGLGVSDQAAQIGRDTEPGRVFSTSALEGLSSGNSAASAARNVSLGVPSLATRGESPRPTSSGTPSDLLLKLLNPSQASKHGAVESGEEQQTLDMVTPVEGMSSDAQDDARLAAIEALPSVSKGQFTYISPFEQLAASSPRNKSGKSAAISGTVTPEIALKPESLVKMTAEALEPPTSSTILTQRTPLEALLGISTDKANETTVSQALDDIGEQVDQEAQEALARANAESAAMEKQAINVVDDNTIIDTKELQQAVREAAIELKQDLKDEEKKAKLESNMPAPMAEAFEATVNDIAQEVVADSWESADAESAKEEGDTGVRVFNFPMKPFVAIDIVNLPPPREIRQDIVMKIASMKKEFDQIDRTLASATSNFIVYAMAKGGGLRIIRQEDGANKQVFRKVGNEIYNVSISAPASSPLSKNGESVLATGVNGSVFWTSINLASGQSFEDEDLDKKGFIFPPLPVSDDNTSGGQLKTRAKLSSRHPELFAVSRGKAIHVIWPSIASSAPYMNVKTRQVDSGKYLSEHCLKIATGKSGKDFAFSEDDTVIVSLDKAGRLKFWDIREHIDSSNGANPSAHRRVETKVPSMVLATTSDVDKSWATSVLFLDKERPMTKGVALRYLLVGSKQNHTLQLWDLGLGKPVQEINFPHENDTDAICSVAYHAKSGIIAVGHPSRNSVFFIYLSSPRYNLGSITQADFVKRLASADPTLPKPESTAIMTGVRELSLASLGQLRSLEICEPASEISKTVEGGDTLFELYVSHSRGVACLDIKRQDLGWDKDGKVIKPVDAVAEEMIEIKELRMPQAIVEATGISESPAKSSVPETIRREEPKDGLKTVPAPVVAPKPSAVRPASPRKESPAKLTKLVASIPVGIEPQAPGAPSQVVQPAQAIDVEKSVETPPKLSTGPEPGSINGTASAEPGPAEDVVAGSMNIDAGQLGETISKALGNTLSAIFGTVLGEQLESLYKRIDDDKRIQEAAGAAKQDAILRLVSSTLTDNVEKSLARIVTSNIQQSLLPAIESVTLQAVKEQLGVAIPRELKASLQGPVAKAMQEPEVLRSISDHVTSKLSSHVENVFTTTLTQKITPAFQKLTVDSARKASSEVEARVVEQLQKVNVQSRNDGAKIDHLTKQHHNDSAKIDQLTKVTMEMFDHIRGLTQSLAQMSTELVNLKSELAEREVQAHQPASPPAVVAPKDEELEMLTVLMSSGKLVEGTIKWLQSSRRVELFDQFFAQYDPLYLKGIDQLIIMTVCAAVTDSFEHNIVARLDWLETGLNAVVPRESVVKEHGGKVMDLLVQRLSDQYMAIAETGTSNPVSAKIRAVVRLAKQVKTMIR